MEERKKCPICGKNVRSESWGIEKDGSDNKCAVCGKYRITGQADMVLKGPNSKYNNSRYILSAVLRAANENGKQIDIDTDNIQEIIDLASIPDGPLEAIDRILLYIYKNSESADSYAFIHQFRDYPIAFAKNIAEFEFYIQQTINLGYIEIGKASAGSIDSRLTLKGWERIDELRKKVKESRQAFVAMWFDEKLQEAFDKAIKPALEETGYKPVRIDLVEHNEKIDDKIIAEIRKSGLLIADFTGHRGGVYFEAGFALGLGIPVVWTCREDHLQGTHFDTRQYNHIVWETPEDLKEKLKNRIEATIPIAR